MEEKIVDRLLASVSTDGVVADVRVGIHWTAVVVETASDRKAGLASTVVLADHPHGVPDIARSGKLIGTNACEIAQLAAHSQSGAERSIGFATMNALLVPDTNALRTLNAEELILERGAGKKVAVIGHFPFVPEVQRRAATAWILELNPRPGDLAADQAPEVLPQADVIAVTGMSLVNGTFEGLAKLFPPAAFVVILGATVPLSPILFDYGIDAVSGTIVEEIEPVLCAVSQGATFRQIPGKRLVTMVRPAAM